MKTAERLQSYISQYAERFSGAWQNFDHFRAGRGVDLPNWPEWCWCPLAAAYAIIMSKHSPGSSDETLSALTDLAPLGALAAWRMTRGIYRYDSDLFSALWETPIGGDLPVDVLYRLPEWCVFVEVPEGAKCRWADVDVLGWFVHLEWDANSARPELRFVFDTEGGLIGFPVHLHAGTLQECVASAIEVSLDSVERYGFGSGIEPALRKRNYTEQIAPFVSVSLYLCAEDPDVVDLRGRKERPGNPEPAKTKKGPRVFPADSATSWQVGYRIGAALRRGQNAMREEAETTGENGSRATPRPHIRRAHWHAYWTGPRQCAQKAILKWLPPIPVGTGELVPTIHLVEKEKPPTD